MAQPATMRAYSKGHPSDDFQTDPEALDSLVPWLYMRRTIWEPAAGNGNLVRSLAGKGFRVIASDIKGLPVKIGNVNVTNIDRPFDFLTDGLPVAPPAPLTIITNPPYSLKNEFLARCYELRVAFALLLPLTVFDSAFRRSLFRRHGVQIIIPDCRLKFTTCNGAHGGGWFMTCWVTWQLHLPRDIVFSSREELATQLRLSDDD